MSRYDRFDGLLASLDSSSRGSSFTDPDEYDEDFLTDQQSLIDSEDSVFSPVGAESSLISLGSQGFFTQSLGNDSSALSDDKIDRLLLESPVSALEGRMSNFYSRCHPHTRIFYDDFAVALELLNNEGVYREAAALHAQIIDLKDPSLLNKYPTPYHLYLDDLGHETDAAYQVSLTEYSPSQVILIEEQGAFYLLVIEALCNQLQSTHQLTNYQRVTSTSELDRSVLKQILVKDKPSFDVMNAHFQRMAQASGLLTNTTLKKLKALIEASATEDGSTNSVDRRARSQAAFEKFNAYIQHLPIAERNALFKINLKSSGGYGVKSFGERWELYMNGKECIAIGADTLARLYYECTEKTGVFPCFSSASAFKHSRLNERIEGRPHHEAWRRGCKREYVLNATSKWKQFAAASVTTLVGGYGFWLMLSGAAFAKSSCAVLTVMSACIVPYIAILLLAVGVAGLLITAGLYYRGCRRYKEALAPYQPQDEKNTLGFA